VSEAPILPAVGTGYYTEERVQVDAVSNRGRARPFDQLIARLAPKAVVIGDTFVELVPAKDLGAGQVEFTMGVIVKVADHVPR